MTTMWMRFALALLVPLAATAQPMEVILPTSNDALFYGDGAGFYMYTDRNFDGEASNPWEGGQYGFHRNLVRTPVGIVGTRFHEGMDIRPRFRDFDGEPLDSIVSVDDGRVVYVNRSASASAYGRYVVVEYDWQGSPYYGLYAHLSDVDAYPGTYVRRGERLGRTFKRGRMRGRSENRPSLLGYALERRVVCHSGRGFSKIMRCCQGSVVLFTLTNLRPRGSSSFRACTTVILCNGLIGTFGSSPRYSTRARRPPGLRDHTIAVAISRGSANS